MSGYSKSTANNYINTYRNALENAIAGVNKNFNQMDFENADAKETMEEHVNNIISYCKHALRELDSISLRD